MGAPYSWHAYISCGSMAYSTETSRRIWHGGNHRTATVQNGDRRWTTATPGNQVVSHSWPKHPLGTCSQQHNQHRFGGRTGWQFPRQNWHHKRHTQDPGEMPPRPWQHWKTQEAQPSSFWQTTILSHKTVPMLTPPSGKQSRASEPP